jgi:O-antigen/teichoic acid export membrane protein
VNEGAAGVAPDKPLASRPARWEAGWLLLARLASAVASFLSLRLLTSILNEEVYGRFALFQGLLALVAGFFIGPLAQAQNRFLHDATLDGHLPELLRWSVKTIAIAAFIGSGAVVAGVYFYWGNDPWWLLVAAAGIIASVASAMSSRIQGFLNTYRWRGRYAALSTFEVWARLLAVLGLVSLLGSSLTSCALGVTAAAVASAVFGVPWLRALAKERPPRTASSCFDPRPLWRFAAPLFAVTLLSWVVSLSDRYIISLSLDDASVGKYVANYQVAAVVPGLVGSIFFPLVSPVLFQDMAQMRGQPLALDRYLLAIGVPPLFVGGFVLADLKAACSLLLGDQSYFAGDLVIPWVMLAMIVMLVQQVLEHEAFYRHATRSLVVANLVAATVNITANLVFLPRFGVVVAAMSTLAAYICSCVTVMVLCRPTVHLASWLKLLAIGLALSASVLLARAVVPESVRPEVRAPLRWLCYGLLGAFITVGTFRDLVRLRRQAALPRL